ncbi:hypothetical protein G4G93_02110 [Methylobacterium sp. DB0501]|nr:hypothetical protein [Methylobacterium sp. DB0501]
MDEAQPRRHGREVADVEGVRPWSLEPTIDAVEGPAVAGSGIAVRTVLPRTTAAKPILRIGRATTQRAATIPPGQLAPDLPHAVGTEVGLDHALDLDWHMSFYVMIEMK